MAETPEASRHAAPAAAPINWTRALSWAFYDFANTIYSAVVVSFAITLHAREFTGAEKYTFIVMAASLLASGLVIPFAGELADRTGRSKRYLFVITLVCCASCAAISAAQRGWLILALFFVANFAYNASLSFYDSLLPCVAPPQRRGLVSGIGVGLGYGGVALAIPIAIGVERWYATMGPAHVRTPLFALAAMLFLFASMPLFVAVPERPSAGPPPRAGSLLALSMNRTLVSLRALPRHPDLLLFLLGNFFCVDALNATIIGYAPYVKNVFGLSDSAVLAWMIPFALCALGLGVLGGKMADRLGSQKTMMLAAGAFILAAAVCAASSSPFTFFPAFLVFGGFGLSTIWVAGRKMLLSLVPPGQVGKYFGLYNVGHKLSMIGIVLFGVLADLRIGGSQTSGYRAGLLVQVVSMTLGLVLISRVKVDDAAR
jgi:UMF1 family MFS transporter